MPDCLEKSYLNGEGKAQDRAVGTICALFRIVRLGVRAAGQTSVQFEECIITPTAPAAISWLLATLHFLGVIFIAVRNT